LLVIEPAERPELLVFADAWREEATGAFDVHVVPGGHRTLLEPPHVAHLGSILRAALRASLEPAKLGATG
jgi:thioesterase domain-containing protein